jgi:mannonate dehydratase
VPDTEEQTLVQHREAAAAAGVSLEMIHFGLPRSIPLALDPQRDADLDAVCRIIENAGRAGLRGLNYNFCILPHQRTQSTPGRGGSSYSTFDLSQFDNDTLSEAGRVDRDEAFARIQYFLERVVPVAEEYKVQLAAHLNDPPAPVLKGVERWNYPMFDGLKRFSELVDSPYHGFNFCCGTCAEGLQNPGEELYSIVRYFAERGKIFNIHFRNIRGGLHNFQEVWPDEGDTDMFRLAQTLYQAGYPYMLIPDHAPGHPDDRPPEGGSGRVRQAWAFQFGYIIAMIQAVKATA